MKKLLYILSAFVLAGCTVSEIGNDTVEVLSKNVVYTAGFEDVDTKVYVDTDLKTHWTEGDEISIFTSTYNLAVVLQKNNSHFTNKETEVPGIYLYLSHG